MIDIANIILVCITCGVLLVLFFPFSISCFISTENSLSYTIKCAGLVLFDNNKTSKKLKSKKTKKKKTQSKKNPAQNVNSSLHKASLVFELLFDTKNISRVLRIGRALKNIFKWNGGFLHVTYGNKDPYLLSMIHSRWYPFEALFPSGSLMFAPQYGTSIFKVTGQAHFSVTVARIVAAFGVIGVSIPYRGLIKIYRGGK